MELDANFFSSLLSIIVINLVLSGDNAVVIALATLRLEDNDRRKGIFWGTFGAVGLRVALTAVAAMLLKIPFVQAIGGALLVWIAVKLLKSDSGDEHVKAAGNLREAIQTIIVADLLMSLDNVLAVAGASKGNIVLLILGLVISVPIVIFGSTLLSSLMKRFPWIIQLGAGLLGFTAGEMILNDTYFHFLTKIHILEYLIPMVIALGVVLIGSIRGKKQSPKPRESDSSNPA